MAQSKQLLGKDYLSEKPVLVEVEGEHISKVEETPAFTPTVDRSRPGRPPNQWLWRTCCQRTRGNPRLDRKYGRTAVAMWCWGFVSDRRDRRSRGYAGLFEVYKPGLL